MNTHTIWGEKAINDVFRVLVCNSVCRDFCNDNNVEKKNTFTLNSIPPTT